MNRNIVHKEVQDFISENFDKDIPNIIFKGSPFQEVSTTELGNQLSGKKKAKKKLPTWFHTQGIIYPPNLNLEQTSSELTAEYKSNLVQGKSLVDLTGGFGIDSYYFSRKIGKVYHCELDEYLSEIVKHNNVLLQANNITCIPGDGLDFLRNSTEKYDWLYLDPSRRSSSGGRVFHLSDCTPNISENLDLLFEKTEKVLLKTAPLLDLQAGITQLQGVKEVHIVAVNNEVKELLWILEKNYSGENSIKTINFSKKEVQTFTGEHNYRPPVSFDAPQNYLYEPNAAIMKSGLFEQLGVEYNLSKLHQNTHLFTAQQLIDFPGRRFKVKEVVPYNRKKIKRLLANEKAHVATRNFPESVETLRKRFKIKDGGNLYLFFTTSIEDESIVLLCEKIG